MSVDLEQRLLDELATVAASTRTEPDALAGILARAGAPHARRPWRPVLVVGVVLGLVLGALALRHQPREESTLFAGLPPRPPALTGTMVATRPWGGLVVADVAAPDGAVNVLPDQSSGTFLADGRVVASQHSPQGSTMLVTPGSSSSVALPVDAPKDHLGLVASMTDGRVVMIVSIDYYGHGPRRQVLRTFDPKAATFTDQPIPSSLRADKVAAGPDGSIAVLGERGDSMWEDPELLIVRPGGQQRRHDLSGLVRNRYVNNPMDFSWGPSGLIAISTQAIHSPTLIPDATWTLVVDPRTGDLVRALDGYEGVAWSPDGRGLLTGRITGPDTSQLVAWWGPGLKERVDVGTTRDRVVPLWWRS